MPPINFGREGDGRFLGEECHCVAQPHARDPPDPSQALDFPNFRPRECGSTSSEPSSRLTNSQATKPKSNAHQLNLALQIEQLA